MKVIWQVSFVNWLEGNIDGATRGCPGLASCYGIFRGSSDDYLCSFSFL